MREEIISILKLGINSPLLNSFIEICRNLSKAVINKSKYKEYILQKTGVSIDDLAYDCIADLFKQTEGKYLYINKYFDDFISDFENIPEDIFKAKLSTLVISRTNQRITEIREEFGEVYFKIKRAAYLHLNRHTDLYKKIIYQEKTYIYGCDEKDIDFNKPPVPGNFILESLYLEKNKKYSVSKIVDLVFDKLNLEKEYNKAISEIDLFRIIADFYKLRKDDYLLNFENVHYYNIEES
jgi:hypothetical protein